MSVGDSNLGEATSTRARHGRSQTYQVSMPAGTPVHVHPLGQRSGCCCSCAFMQKPVQKLAPPSSGSAHVCDTQSFMACMFTVHTSPIGRQRPSRPSHIQPSGQSRASRHTLVHTPLFGPTAGVAQLLLTHVAGAEQVAPAGTHQRPPMPDTGEHEKSALCGHARVLSHGVEHTPLEPPRHVPEKQPWLHGRPESESMQTF